MSSAEVPPVAGSAESPNHATRARVSPAMPATRGSSRFSTATSLSSRSVTISDLALAVPSMLPNPPACASPTFSTTPTSGRASATSRAMSPAADAPISATRYSVSCMTRSIVIGPPTALLNEAWDATVGPTRPRISRRRFLVVVLPLEPVMPTTRSRSPARTRATTSFASAARAVVASATTTCGTSRSRGRSTISSAAPRSSAAPAKSWPSIASPTRATNTPPGAISRESVSTAPSISDPPTPVGRTSPATARAIWSIVSGITAEVCSSSRRFSRRLASAFRPPLARPATGDPA